MKKQHKMADVEVSISNAVDLLAQALLEVDQRFGVEPQVRDPKVRQREKRRLEQLVARLTLTTEQIANMLDFEAYHYDTLRMLELDVKFREHRDVRLIYPLDFTEILSYIHANEPGFKWGKTVEYFIWNNDNPNYVFTILPGTVWEFLHYLRKIWLSTREAARDYENFIKRHSWIQKILISLEKGAPAEAIATYLQEGTKANILALATEKGLKSSIAVPTQKFMHTVNSQKILFVDEIADGLKHVTDHKDMYEGIYFSAYDRLRGGRSSYDISNKIDAHYIAGIRLLNEMYNGNPYFSIISRGFPLRIFRGYSWRRDPILKLRAVTSKRPLPVSRGTQFAFYMVHLDQHCQSYNEKLHRISSGELLISDSICQTIEMLRNIAHSVDIPPVAGLPGKGTDQYQDEGIQYFTTVTADLPCDIVGEDMPDVLAILADKDKFRQGMEQANDSVRNWAKSLYSLLEQFARGYEPAPEIPEVAEVLNWLSCVSKI